MTNIQDNQSREIARSLWAILEGSFEEELVEMIQQWEEAHPE